MQKWSKTKLTKLIFLAASVVASILWYLDYLIEPTVAIVSSIFGLLIAIFELETAPVTSENSKQSNIISEKQRNRLNPERIFMILLFITLLFTLFFSNRSETVGIKGNHNNNNQVEINN